MRRAGLASDDLRSDVIKIIREAHSQKSRSRSRSRVLFYVSTRSARTADMFPYGSERHLIIVAVQQQIVKVHFQSHDDVKIELTGAGARLKLSVHHGLEMIMVFLIC